MKRACGANNVNGSSHLGYAGVGLAGGLRRPCQFVEPLARGVEDIAQRFEPESCRSRERLPACPKYPYVLSARADCVGGLC